MDKYEYRVKTEQMLKYMEEKSYEKAMEIADTIDWRRAKNVSMLYSVSEIYEQNKQYKKGREVLFVAYERSPESRKIVYRLATLALKAGEAGEAMDCYEEFIKIAPKDPNQHILRYKILREKQAPLEEQITALEEFKKAEYVEKWAYELARLYNDAGMTAKCLEECDDLILWFSEGKYVHQAMELKMKYKPLTPMQQEKYKMYPKVEASGRPVPSKEAIKKDIEKLGNVATEKFPIKLEATAGETENIEDTEEEKQITGQMRIDEILAGWEEKQKEIQSTIDAKKDTEVSKESPKEVQAVSELPEDIRQALEEAESGGKVKEPKEPTETNEMLNDFETLEAPGEVVEDKHNFEEYEEIKDFEELEKEVLEAANANMGKVPLDDEVIIEERTPLSRKEAAKAVATGKTGRIPVEEVQAALQAGTLKQDTGFIVQGRYDLDAQSEIGIRAGLTEEQKKLFSYFVPVRGMSEQLVDVLENDIQSCSRQGTSSTGNLLIVGRKGSGKTVLAVDVVKAIQKQRNLKQGKVAIVTGEALNRKKMKDVFEKLYGGALIIEKASAMSEKTVMRLNRAMENETGELLVVLEEQRKLLDALLTSNREFRRKFTSRLEVPVFINDELVTFGQTYAKENECKIDEMGILALYSKIDKLQREDHPVTVAEVKDILDIAIASSQKGAKKIVKRVLGKATDDSNRVILTEKDFRF